MRESSPSSRRAVSANPRCCSVRLHGGDGRFDLVRPERCNSRSWRACARPSSGLRAACPLVAARGRAPDSPPRRMPAGEGSCAGSGAARRAAQRLVTPTQVQKVRREQRKTQRRAERERVPHRPQRQPVQREADRKHCREERERREYAPFLTQILHKKLHIFTPIRYPTPNFVVMKSCRPAPARASCAGG